MKLLIDMNLSPLWVDFLRRGGVDAVHWSQVGEPRARDTVLLSWAREHHHVVFTHDLDFSRILALTHASGPSVFQVRDEDNLPSVIGPIVLHALQQHAEALEAGAVVVLDSKALRVRILPL